MVGAIYITVPDENMSRSGNGEVRERSRLPCWSVPVTETLDRLVEDAVARDTHVSKSDLIRDAVREKLQRMKQDENEGSVSLRPTRPRSTSGGPGATRQ